MKSRRIIEMELVDKDREKAVEDLNDILNTTTTRIKKLSEKVVLRLHKEKANG